MLRSASGGTRETKGTSPNLCRLEAIQLEKTSSAWYDLIWRIDTNTFGLTVQNFVLTVNTNKHDFYEAKSF